MTENTEGKKEKNSVFQDFRDERLGYRFLA